MPTTGEYEIDAMTSPEFGELVAGGRLVVLLPVGSVEPHGPHMSLATDTVISLGAARLAAKKLAALGLDPAIAPAIPYGVTECAAAFPGAISVPASVLTPMVGAIVDGYLRGGAIHVCVINNHLEPAQDSAIRDVASDREGISIACPLQRKWARTLTEEFKSGACHAGRYETSIVLACDASLVDQAKATQLPEVPISLSEKLGEGIGDFAAMGLSNAYAGNPALATAKEGHESLEHLAQMIVAQVQAGLPQNNS